MKRRKHVRGQAQSGGKHGTSGLSLIEILIIIAILGILAVVCVPNLMILLGR